MVLAQLYFYGGEAPIALASVTLGLAENKTYSQLHKGGLAIVESVNHFHQYIAGRHVTTITDHETLLAILGA